MKKQLFQNKSTRKYYKQIHHRFPILSQQEKRFLHFFKNHLKDYESHHPHLEYDDFINHFGKPEDIISAYYEHIESEFIINHMKSRKMIKRALIIFITVFLIVSTYVVYIYYRAFHEFKDTQIYYEQTVIEDFGDIEEE